MLKLALESLLILHVVVKLIEDVFDCAGDINDAPGVLVYDLFFGVFLFLPDHHIEEIKHVIAAPVSNDGAKHVLSIALRNELMGPVFKANVHVFYPPTVLFVF